MRLLFIFMPRGWRQRQKYSGKMAKAQWQDVKHQRHAQRHAAAVARWQAMTAVQKRITIAVCAVLLVVIMIAGH